MTLKGGVRHVSLAVAVLWFGRKGGMEGVETLGLINSFVLGAEVGEVRTNHGSGLCG